MQPSTLLSPSLSAPSLRRRMACWLYESLLLFGVVFVGGIVLGAAGVLFGAPLSPRTLQAMLFVVLGMYFAWFWSKGQTLAMKTWHIQVVDTYGRPLTRIRALARYALAWLWLLPPLAMVAPFHLPVAEVAVLTFGWVAVWALLSRFHPQRQFFHDVLAGTRLIDTAQEKQGA
ncbi:MULTISPECIES: RDD family protein [Comamonas]|uniref:RDD family protein n=1 Tax=Comamonas TaxID=283 RepID=UPI00257DCD91|nr:MULTISPECIES: RDD family protein [Comamonas]